MNTLERTSVLGLLISITILVPDITTVSVQIGTKAVLHCPRTPSKKAKLIIWEIALISQPPCTISYRVENNETHKGCADERITWASTPDQSPDLQINAVALGHDGHYSCQIHTLMKNFQQEYSFHVIVPPEVTLVQGENRTAVCEAIAGKPVAQIFWTPDGDCKTVTASHSNGTTTVRSTCHWEHNNVSDVFCFVSYLTGSKLMSIELNQVTGVTSTLSSLLIILYMKLSLLGIILLTVGFAFFQKSNYFRK